jgi:DNA-binding NarL/FixJ family response regulator
MKLQETNCLVLSPHQIPIVIVDDHDIWRDGVRSMLSSTEFSIVGEASSGMDAPGLVETCKPRIVLLDIRMAGGDGFEALKEIKRLYPQVLVLMLTTYSSKTFVARALASGASGYLTKGLSRAEFIEALRKVAGGGTLLTQQELESSLKYLNSTDLQENTDGMLLDSSEVELLRMLVAGTSNRDISAALSVTIEAACSNVERIVRKLGVSDRVQAAVWAIKHGTV